MSRKGALTGAAILVAAFVVLVSASSAAQLGCWQNRETIYIYGNRDFTCEKGVVAGSGTAHDPYIIAGLQIDATGVDFGINIEHSSQHVLIRNCVIEAATSAAIRLLNVSNISIEGCLLIRNERGILFESSRNNAILGNLIAENRTGAELVLGSQQNTACGNSFILNGRPARDPGGGNLWYCGLTGNYWGDYEGNDVDCNGIGDEPYVSPVVDRYPLVDSPWTCSLPVDASSASHCDTSTTLLREVAPRPAPCVSPPCETFPCVSPPCGSAACPRPDCVPACGATCDPRVTACADQVLTCVQPEATLAADLCLSESVCDPMSIVWTRSGFGTVGSGESITVREPGAYVVEVTGANGCTVSDTVIVAADLEVPTVTASVDRALSCALPEAILEAQVLGGSPPYVVEWIFRGGVIGRGETITVSVPGTYTVRASGKNGCSAMATVDVVQDVGAPRVEATADRILSCVFTETDLRARATGGSAPYTYEWRNAAGNVLGTDPVVTVSEAGTYTVRVIGYNGCAALANVIVPEDTEPPVVQAYVDKVLTCDTTEVALTADISRGRPPYAIEWITPSGRSICRAATVIVDEPGRYHVRVTGSNGCTSTSSVVVLDDTEPPLVDAGPDQMLTLETPEVTLTATVTRAPGPYTVTWEDTLGEIVGTSETLTTGRAGVYTVTVVRDTGCSASDEVIVTTDFISEVVLTSSIEGLAVFGQLTMDGVPIPESTFLIQVEGTDVDGSGEPATITMTNLYAEGYRANGAEVYYIIPGNSTVEFGIHKEQFIAGKKYYLLHLPTDPPGEAAVAFF